MTSDEAVALSRAHVESLFPKVCSNCGRHYATLAEYVRETRHVGPPISYDAEVGDWTPSQPIGTVAFANCACGTTLAIGSEGMPMATLVRLMAWGRIESLRRGVSLPEILHWLRAEIDRQVLEETRGG